MIFSCVLLEHVLTFRRLVLIVLRSTNHHHPSYTSYLADMKLNVKEEQTITLFHTFSFLCHQECRCVHSISELK
jgi:hypothetical protein